jgi:hypothetical protein
MSRAHYRVALYSAPCRSSSSEINEYEFQSGYIANYFYPNMGETARRRPTGTRPYGRSWQRPGVTLGYWPVPRRRTRMSWRGSWLANYGPAAAPRYTVTRNSRLYRLQRTRGRHGNLARRSRHTAPAASRGAGRKVIYDYPRHFRDFCRQRLPAAGGRARGPVRPVPVIRAGRVHERGLGPRRGMIDTARIGGRPPRSDPICHARLRGHQLPDISSSTALK